MLLLFTGGVREYSPQKEELFPWHNLQSQQLPESCLWLAVLSQPPQRDGGTHEKEDDAATGQHYSKLKPKVLEASHAVVLVILKKKKKLDALFGHWHTQLCPLLNISQSSVKLLFSGGKQHVCYRTQNPLPLLDKACSFPFGTTSSAVFLDEGDGPSLTHGHRPQPCASLGRATMDLPLFHRAPTTHGVPPSFSY